MFKNYIIFIYFAQELVWFILKTRVFLQFWKILSHSPFEYCLSLIVFVLSSGMPTRGVLDLSFFPQSCFTSSFIFFIFCSL